ncbi:hypothetical protein DFQ29_002044 [Apophysomyces sp. BC1021]|nr:hypothetical protein DFQ29_002044 [Apophysomyces sp. BC1021]
MVEGSGSCKKYVRHKTPKQATCEGIPKGNVLQSQGFDGMPYRLPMDGVQDTGGKVLFTPDHKRSYFKYPATRAARLVLKDTDVEIPSTSKDERNEEAGMPSEDDVDINESDHPNSIELKVLYNRRIVKHHFEVMSIARKYVVSIGTDLMPQFGILLGRCEEEIPTPDASPAGSVEERSKFIKPYNQTRSVLCPKPWCIYQHQKAKQYFGANIAWQRSRTL